MVRYDKKESSMQRATATTRKDPIHPAMRSVPTAAMEAAKCPGCSPEGEEDLREAIQNLSRKYTDLALLMAQYMSQAGLDRGARTANARDFAAELIRIVGGVPAAPGEFPECCLIGNRATNGTFFWYCTGVLVHPRVVLTAAHCNVPTQLPPINRVALQAQDQNALQGAEILSVKRVASHPGYRGSLPGNDISVLILRKDAQTPHVPLATTAEIGAAKKTQLVGFGNSDIKSTKGFGILRKVEVDITNIRRKAADNLDDEEEELGFESDMEFTAGGGGFDSCNGDSGGPAYITVGAGRRVAGLTSRGFQFSTDPCGEGGIYTRVDSMRPFINSVLAAAGMGFEL
jgi:secreted trypsin-like serine protease